VWTINYRPDRGLYLSCNHVKTGIVLLLLLLWSGTGSAGGPNQIEILQARIGCLDIQHEPNLTALVARQCNGHSSCSYKAPTQAEYRRAGVRAKTRSFCTQAMEITFRCGANVSDQVTVPGDAWRHPPAMLSCNPRQRAHVKPIGQDRLALSATGYGRIGTTFGSDKLAGLSTFELQFGRYDARGQNTGTGTINHKLRTVGVWHYPENSAITASLSDRTRNTQFRFYVSYFPLPEGSRSMQTAKAGCRRTCSMSIARPASNEIFVLRGFLVRRINGDDNLQKLAVLPKANQGRVDVTFTGKNNAPFNTEIQYAYVSRRWLDGPYVTNIQDRKRYTTLYFGKREPGRALLQGFSFEFANGDHQIHVIKLNPANEKDDSWSAAFDDKNTQANPTRIRAIYTILRRTPRTTVQHVVPKPAPKSRSEPRPTR